MRIPYIILLAGTPFDLVGKVLTVPSVQGRPFLIFLLFYLNILKESDDTFKYLASLLQT